MTKRIYGGYDVTHQAFASGLRTVQSIDGTLFDADGNMVLDGYTRAELEDIISTLPLSHYGTHNYLPAGVSGDFVGASENTLYRRIKILLEDDGTMVALRPGTNGGSVGIYYSYLPNILNTTNLSSSINTNKIYHPGYFPAGKYALSIISSNRGIVCGAIQTGDTGNNDGTFFTSLTKGTLDDTQHTGFIIPYATVCPNGGSLENVFLGEDGYIYYVELISTPTVNFGIVRVLFNESSGTFTSAPITGWNGNLLYANTAGASTIKLCNNLVDSVAANQPYMLVPAGLLGNSPFMVSYDIYGIQDKASGNIRIRLNGDAWATTSSYNVRPQHGLSFVINPTTKAVALDTGYVTGPSLTITDTGSALVASGNLVKNTDIYYHSGDANLGNTYEYTSLNQVICVSTPNLGRPPHVQVAGYSTDVTPYNMLNWKANPNINYRIGSLFESYGSPIGQNTTSVELLPNNTTKQMSVNGRGSAVFSTAEHKVTPNFTFKSTSYGTLQGYEPTVNRNSYNYDANKTILISSISGSTVTTNGGIFIQGVRETTPLTYDSSMNSTGSISVDATAFNNIKNSEFAKVTTALSATSSKNAVLYVPQQTNIPAFLYLSAGTTTRDYYYRIVEVNVNSRTSVTSISFKRLVSEAVVPTNLTLTNSASTRTVSAGITIYDAGTFYFIGGSDPLIRPTVGNDISFAWRATVDKTTQQFTNFNINGSYTSNVMGLMPSALPGIGFGYMSSVDAATKVVFTKTGTTLSEYTNWTNQGNPIVVVSQDVAQGFIVYFTEETPVMLSGKSFTMPIQNIDLRTVKANPANTTFHLYVRMEQGIAKYYITENVIAETGTSAYNIFWIGTIQTNSTQIASINVKKRSRLDVFGESLEAAGSSFPVSYGMPSGNGTINW